MIWDGFDLGLGQKYVQLIKNFDAEVYWKSGTREN